MLKFSSLIMHPYTMVQCGVSYRMATGMITRTAELNCTCLRGVAVKIGNQQDMSVRYELM
jgi:hypothetical protein